MTEDRRATLSRWLQRLTTEPLDPTDPAEDRYVELAEAGRGAVDEIFSLIDLSIPATAQLLSGPQGSGKTTELLRLRGRLRDAGFTVVYADVLAYVNRSAEIDVTEFLIALGLALGEALLPDDEARAQRGFLSRLGEFARRMRISFDFGAVAGSASAEGITVEAMGVGVEAGLGGVDLERELKGSRRFVAELRDKLAYHLGEFHELVAEFFASLSAEEFAQSPSSRGIVMIVDGLEKLRGSSANDGAVQASVERLFVYHGDKLRYPSLHLVYTVPPYLLFTDTGALPFDGSVNPVPVPAVRDRQGHPATGALEEMVQVVARRIPWDELLSSKDLLREVVLVSGGHLRDLFRLLQTIITQANARGAPLPADAALVNAAIRRVALDFSQITSENAAFLRSVDAQRGAISPTEADVGRLARLVDTHMLLAHLNGETWYEVHPLARRTLDLMGIQDERADAPG